MADPYALVSADAMAPPDLPEVGVNIPNFQEPDAETLAEIVAPPGAKGEGEVPAAAPPAATPAPAATPPPAAAPAAPAPTPEPPAKTGPTPAEIIAEEKRKAAERQKQDEEELKRKADLQRKKEADAEKKKADEEAAKKAADKKRDEEAAKSKEDAKAKEEADKKKAAEEADKKKLEEAAKKKLADEAAAEAEAAKQKAAAEAEAAKQKAAAAAPAPTPVADPPAPPAPAAAPAAPLPKSPPRDPTPSPAAPAPIPLPPAAIEAPPQAQAPSQGFTYPSSPQNVPMQQYPFPFFPSGYPTSPFSANDGGGEKARELESTLKQELARADKRLEETSRNASDEMRSLKTEVGTLKEMLRSEREQRLATEVQAQAQQQAKELLRSERDQRHASETQAQAQLKENFERQYQDQIKRNADLERRLLEKDNAMNTRLDEFRNKQSDSRESIIAAVRAEMAAEGSAKKATASSEQQRAEYEAKLSQERGEYASRVAVMQQLIDVKQRGDIIELLRREAAEREWEEGLQWDDFARHKKDERRHRKEVEVNLRRRARQAQQLPTMSGTLSPQYPTLADKAFASLQGKPHRDNAVYTTKAFQKVFEVLEGCDLVHYAPVFAANEFDIHCLAAITEDDMNALGITTLGARKRLLAEAEKLRMEITRNPEEEMGNAQNIVEDEVTSEWCKERMSHMNRASGPDVFAQVLAWDDAWRHATALDAEGAPSGTPGGHKGELLLKRLSGAPPPGSVGVGNMGGPPVGTPQLMRPPSPPPSRPPPPMPPTHIDVFHTDDGIPYYYNTATGETTWQPPGPR